VSREWGKIRGDILGQPYLAYKPIKWEIEWDIMRYLGIPHVISLAQTPAKTHPNLQFVGLM